MRKAHLTILMKAGSPDGVYYGSCPFSRRFLKHLLSICTSRVPGIRVSKVNEAVAETPFADPSR